MYLEQFIEPGDCKKTLAAKSRSVNRQLVIETFAKGKLQSPPDTSKGQTTFNWAWCRVHAAEPAIRGMQRSFKSTSKLSFGMNQASKDIRNYALMNGSLDIQTHI